MSARKRKAMRQVAYMACPPCPWVTLKRLGDYGRMLANRGRPLIRQTVFARIENFRFINRPEIPNP